MLQYDLSLRALVIMTSFLERNCIIKTSFCIIICYFNYWCYIYCFFLLVSSFSFYFPFPFRVGSLVAHFKPQRCTEASVGVSRRTSF